MPEEFVEDILTEITPAKGTPAEEIENDLSKPSSDSEEVIEEKVNEEEVPAEKNSKADLTIEDLATQIGWNPNHEGKDKVDAATFILRSREIQETMRDNNKDLKNQLSNVQGSIEALKEHNERVYRADVRRMQTEIETLKKEKRSAVELADVEKVDEIEQKIENIQKDLVAPKQTTPNEPPANPVYSEWIKDNQWYLDDQEMAQYAEVVAQQYQGAPLDRIYKIIRNKVAEVFPDKFESEKQTTTKPIGPKSPVESPTNKGNNKSTFTKTDLTPDQLVIMNQFVKSGVMTEDQYIKDIAKMQE